MNCTKCPNLCSSRSQIVLPDFYSCSIEEKILVIGEAPGAKEDSIGSGFQGIAGKNLDELFRMFNLVRKRDYLCANTVWCRPPNNRKPTKSELVNCAPHLTQLIENSRPTAIVTVGAVAWNHFVPNNRDNLETVIENFLEQSHFAIFYSSRSSTKQIPLVPLPHTSPLCWYRYSNKGDKWSDLGRECLSHALQLIEKSR